MATERQSPDSIVSSTNLTGAVGDIDDDPDSPDGNWLTATTDQNDTMLEASFPTPTGSPTEGAGLQEFRAQLRRTDNPGGSDPSYSIHLYDNGLDKGEIGTGTVSSTTGEVVSATWNATLLDTADGSGVEFYIFGTVVKKNSMEIGAVEWNVDYSVGTIHNGEAQSDGSSTAAADGDVDHTGATQSDGTSTASADGNVDHTGVTQSDGTSTATADGEVDHTGVGQSDGTSTASADGNVDHTGVTQSDGTSTASADGNVDHTGAGQSDGTSTATGTGTTGTTHEGATQSDGTSTAAADGNVDHTGIVQSDGVSAATAAGDVDHTGVAQSDGTSTASADGNVEHTGSAQSDGTSTATGTGVVGAIHEGAAQSDGTSTSTADGNVDHTGAGQADGVSTATCAAVCDYAGAGQSSGTSTATADGVEVNRYRYTSVTDVEAVEKAKQGIDDSAMTNKDLRYGVFEEDTEILDLYMGGNQLDSGDQAILDAIVASLPELDPIETCRYFCSANGSEWNLSITDAGETNVEPL